MKRRRRSGLLGLLLADKKFSIALACIVVSIGGLGVGLPKIWVVTPEGFVPVLRVSLLDMVQARMISRTARRLDAEGRPKDALQAWLGALGNQPADAKNVRSFVDLVLGQEGLERRWLDIGAQQSQWLVALKGTNDTQAAELAGRLCLKAGMPEIAWTYLNTTNGSISIPAAKALAEAAFKTGRMKEFGAAWNARLESMKDEPTLALYKATWQAVAGPPAEQGRSMTVLEQSANVPELKVLALRLRSMVEAERLDVDAFERSFEELRSLRQEDLEDHARSWLVLEAAGRHATAVSRATSYAVPPETSQRARLLLSTWAQLRLESLASDFSRNQLDGFANDPGIWFLASQMLVRAEDWDEVRSVAVRIRRHSLLSRVFAGYSEFLEGVAENAVGRKERARNLFEQLEKRLPEEAMLGTDAADTLERLGFHGEATKVLQRMEAQFGSSPQYWFSMGRLAWQQRDSELLLKAAEKAYSLQPASLENVINLAAALLINRTRPAEAIQLTLQVIQQVPYQHGPSINHAFALVRNGRSAEARRILDDIPLSALSNEERTFWRLAAAEMEVADGNLAAVAKHLPDIDRQVLYPLQKKWLEEVGQQIAAPPGSPLKQPN